MNSTSSEHSVGTYSAEIELGIAAQLALVLALLLAAAGAVAELA
jgi:hypothetical protein